MTSPPVKRALLSLSNKAGLDAFARALHECGVEIYSSGGTSRFLAEAGVPVREISQYTGFPEMMEGRIKTLHPKVHAGILARHDHPDDLQSLDDHDIVTFELVVVNLYPFQSTVARAGVTEEEAVEQIDIGGPTMVRAAAKNFAFVTVVTDPSQYGEVLAQLRADGRTTRELRRRLAGEAFEHTARYDRAIADYFARPAAEGPLPSQYTVTAQRRGVLRYGENPHQSAGVYAVPGGEAGIVGAEQLHGKELSYNNLLDLDSALGIVRALAGPAAVVIKHNNPCGAAEADTLADALRRAMAGDPLSAFGSVLGLNRAMDAAAAEVLAEPGLFVEAIVAPDFTSEALEILTTRPKWKANVRLLRAGPVAPLAPHVVPRWIAGGLLLQAADVAADPEAEWQVVTESRPSDAQMADLRFAWEMVRHVKSNAITVCKERTLLGAGAGQMSRVDSVEIALRKAGDRAAGAVLASDAFFPFADSIERAAAAGLTAIIQPGGSKKDDEVIAACNAHRLPMIFTGRRHFKH